MWMYYCISMGKVKSCTERSWLPCCCYQQEAATPGLLEGGNGAAHYEDPTDELRNPQDHEEHEPLLSQNMRSPVVNQHRGTMNVA